MSTSPVKKGTTITWALPHVQAGVSTVSATTAKFAPKSHHRLAPGSFRLVRRRFGFSCIMAASGVRIFS